MSHLPLSRSALGLAILAGLICTLVWFPVFALPSSGSQPDEVGPSGGPQYGEGWWINATESPLCGGSTGRVCAEFVDKLAGSPYTGVFCCVDSSEISLGRFSSCVLQFSRPPREDEEE